MQDALVDEAGGLGDEAMGLVDEAVSLVDEAVGLVDEAVGLVSQGLPAVQNMGQLSPGRIQIFKDGRRQKSSPSCSRLCLELVSQHSLFVLRDRR